MDFLSAVNLIAYANNLFIIRRERVELLKQWANGASTKAAQWITENYQTQGAFITWKKGANASWAFLGRQGN